MDKSKLIDIIIDNTEYDASNKRKKINQKQQLKKMLSKDIDNTEATLFKFLIKIIDENKLNDTIIKMSKIAQMTNAEIKKLIQDHNDFYEIKIPKGASKKILLKIIGDKGYKIDHQKKQLVKITSVLKKPVEKKKVQTKTDKGRTKQKTEKYLLTKEEKAGKEAQIKEVEDKAKENKRIRNLLVQLDDEWKEHVPLFDKMIRKKTLTDDDIEDINDMLEDLRLIKESYSDEELEDEIPEKLENMIRLSEKMTKSKEAFNMKVDKKPDASVEGKKKQQALPKRKGKKPPVSQPLKSGQAPKKQEALPQRKSRKPLQLKQKDIKKKPQYKVDVTKQPKTTPSKVKISVKPDYLTKKIVPKPKPKKKRTAFENILNMIMKEVKLDDEFIVGLLQKKDKGHERVTKDFRGYVKTNEDDVRYKVTNFIEIAKDEKRLSKSEAENLKQIIITEYDKIYSRYRKEAENIEAEITGKKKPKEKVVLKPKKEKKEIKLDDVDDEQGLKILHEFITTFKNNINSPNQDLFADRDDAQKLMEDTFKKIKATSLANNKGNSGFQGTNTSVSKWGIRVLNAIVKNNDDDMETGIFIDRKAQPFRHFVRYIHKTAKKEADEKKSKGIKGITKEDLPNYSYYTGKILIDMATKNNVKKGANRFKIINNLLNAGIEVPPRKKGEKPVKQAPPPPPKEDEVQEDTDEEEEEEDDEPPPPPKPKKERTEPIEVYQKRRAKVEEMLEKLVYSLAQDFNFKITLDQEPYEITGSQESKVEDEILDPMKDPAQRVNRYEDKLDALKKMNIQGLRKISRSAKKLIPLVDKIIKTNRQKLISEPKKQEVRKAKGDIDLEPFDYKAFIEEMMDEADKQAENDDDEEEELGVDAWKSKDPRLLAFVDKMKQLSAKIRGEDLPKMKVLKDIRVVGKKIRQFVKEWTEEENVVFDDDLEELLVDNLVETLRKEGKDIVKKKEEDDRYLATFKGITGHSTDPYGNHLEWKTLQEYKRISGQVHDELMKKYTDEDPTELNEWKKFFETTLPADRDEWLNKIDRKK